MTPPLVVDSTVTSGLLLVTLHLVAMLLLGCFLCVSVNNKPAQSAQLPDPTILVSGKLWQLVNCEYLQIPRKQYSGFLMFFRDAILVVSVKFLVSVIFFELGKYVEYYVRVFNEFRKACNFVILTAPVSTAHTIPQYVCHSEGCGLEIFHDTSFRHCDTWGNCALGAKKKKKIKE